MAAKVAMVAVPTVLGIASIRVYRVKEAPADGLVSRDRLNIYAPLPGADPPKAVPESPGLLERGLTTTRQSVLPAVQAVKGACVSVKRGSVNLYHAGEDVFYYLIDPPPGFLPRFGTVTMAGLLGMFLARKAGVLAAQPDFTPGSGADSEKATPPRSSSRPSPDHSPVVSLGSRFKRLAVPLGLMSAGASVCYPAQAVSVLKVTGQKVYAAGQWSGAAASSLLASREPVAKEAAASQPQPLSEADPESSLREEEASADLLAKSAAVLETEVESAESVPISDEPVVTEEPPVALTGISPAEIGWSADSEPAQTEPSRPAEDAAADGNRASDDVSLDATPADAVQDEPTGGSLPSAPAVESAAESEPAEEQQSLPAAEATPTSTPATPPPPPQQPAEGSRKEGSSFQPDPALMDFGQSSPEDEDLYSTRS